MRGLAQGGITSVRPSELRQLSELMGGRKARPCVIWDARRYTTSGSTSLEFFRADGQQKDFGNVDSTSIEHISNVVTAGKMDEPFLIQRIGCEFITASDYVTVTDPTDYMYVMKGGMFTFEINNNPVLEVAPVGYLGSPMAFGGQCNSDSGGFVSIPSNLKNAMILDPAFFVEENVTIRGLYQNTEARTVTVQGWLAIYLIGIKFFKA